MSTLQYMGFDLETTGLDPAEHGIVEIGAIIYDAAGRELDRFIHNCNPGTVVYDPKALEINGLTVRQIEFFPHIVRVLSEFIHWAGQYKYVIPVASNAAFDVSFMLEALRLHVPSLEPKWRFLFCKPVCMYGFSHAFFPGEPVLPQAKLGERLGIGNSAAHTTAGDIEQMTACFFALKGQAKR